MAPISPVGIHHFWNALNKSSESKSLADLAVALMTMTLAEVGNERIFSLKRDMIGIYAIRAITELLHARTRIKVHADSK
jgi:hypothetical protein